ncbi:hypothetical protein AAFF_G00241370 [Aldrovandia affinis]|uniref:Uncharacterized protein n=1 Tax=Aldrovandia affinis TaxID=143900 RepID=A0AAD7SWK2_9TELE|nr:hypothetical protein AAFF_G00241370 [Aldrovandia affinis]
MAQPFRPRTSNLALTQQSWPPKTPSRTVRPRPAREGNPPGSRRPVKYLLPTPVAAVTAATSTRWPAGSSLARCPSQVRVPAQTEGQLLVPQARVARASPRTFPRGRAKETHALCGNAARDPQASPAAAALPQRAAMHSASAPITPPTEQGWGGRRGRSVGAAAASEFTAPDSTEAVTQKLKEWPGR